MKINGETIIITSKDSSLSEKPIIVRLIAEFTTSDTEIKSFCYKNNLNVKFDKDGNYIIDLAGQLGFISMNIENDFVFLALPPVVDEEQLALLEYCKSILVNTKNMAIYYYDKEDGSYEFKQKLISEDEIKEKNFVSSYLKKLVEVVNKEEKVKKISKKSNAN